MAFLSCNGVVELLPNAAVQRPRTRPPYHGPLQLLVRRLARALVVCLHVLPLGLCNDKLQLFALKSDPWRHDRARIVS
jgi:hypothetical protein